MFLNSYGARSDIEQVQSTSSISDWVPELSETSSWGLYLLYTSICSFWNIWLHVFFDSEVEPWSSKIVVVTQVSRKFSLSVALHEWVCSMRMAEIPDFNLNHEGMFGDKSSDCSDPELEDTCVGSTEDDEGRTVLNETLADIDFDPVAKWVLLILCQIPVWKKIVCIYVEKKMLWAVTLYREWSYRRCAQPCCPLQICWSNIEKPDCLYLTNFQNVLCCFVNEVRRKDQKEFPGETLKQIVIMLQLYLEKQGFHYKLIDDPLMSKFRNTLNNIMKKCTADGLGHRDSSLSIDLEDENILWEKNILGNSDTDQLRDTVFFLLGINFALRRGEEHKNLRSPGHNPQITVGKDHAHECFLQYREDMKEKTHQGGLSFKIKLRTLKVYGSSNPSRNVINLYTQYIRLLPAELKNSSLYKYSLPASKRTACQWYSDRLIGINQLKKVMNSLMSRAGLEGKYTNHSLRATCATCMFEAGVDEQWIKTFTGHKSDTVWDYKCVSDSLMRKASSTVSTPDNDTLDSSQNPSLETPKKVRNQKGMQTQKMFSLSRQSW